MNNKIAPQARLDSATLDKIAQLLGDQWDGDTLDNIAELIRQSGRIVLEVD